MSNNISKKICVPYVGCKPTHITQKFGAIQGFDGNPHSGVDFWFSNCYGTFLLSPADCRVNKVITDETIDNDYYSAFKKGYGVVLERLDDPSITYLYWHMLQIIPVSVGQILKQGDVVGQMGNSGYCITNGVEVPLKDRGSKGSHLHFEERRNGKLVDPLLDIDWTIPVKLDKQKAIDAFFIKLSNLLLGRK